MKKIGIVGSDSTHAVTLTRQINFPDGRTGAYRFPEYRVTHLYGFDGERNREVAAEAKIPHIVPSPEEMIGEVDAAILVFRHGDLHHRYAMPFIDARIPIWVDKPFTIRVGEARELVQAARRRGTVLVGGSIIPTLPQVQELRQAVAGGKMGRIQTASVSFAAPLANDYGGLVFYGSHAVETAMTIFGFEARSVLAGWTGRVVTAVARYEEFPITVNWIDYNKNLYVTVFADEGEVMKKIVPGEEAKTEGVRRFIEILEGRRNPQGADELIRPVAFLAAVGESLRTGREAPLDESDRGA